MSRYLRLGLACGHSCTIEWDAEWPAAGAVIACANCGGEKRLVTSRTTAEDARSGVDMDPSGRMADAAADEAYGGRE